MKSLNFSIPKSFLALIVTAGLTLIACEQSDEPTPFLDTDKKVTVKAGASFSSLSNSAGRLSSDITLSKFIVNISEIEFEIDEDDPRYGTDSTFSDAEFKGPFEVDLLADTIAFEIASAEIPVGVYEEIEFEIDESRDSGSELFGKSVLIEGEINGVPFIFWTDEDEDFEIDFNSVTGDLNVSESGFVLTINFNLGELITNVDFSFAKDGNEDGIIEIYPEDPDGNGDLAEEVLDKLSDIVEMDEDEDLDEDGKGNDEDEDIDGDGIDNDEDDDDDNDGEKDEDDEDDDNDGKNDEDEEDEEDDD